MDDLISRQEAIDAFYKHPNIDWTTLDVLAKINALPSAQEKRTDKCTKTHSCDCIERKAAIDALDKRFDSIPMEQTTEILLLRKDLRELPSAQSETHEKRTETHACDLIDRQTAIDAILAVTGNSSVRELYEHVQEHELSDMWSGGVNAAIDIIIALPSAQPEIIRCKDCKHWREGDAYSYCQKLFNCGVLDVYDYMRAEDDFCSLAERREE